MAGDIRGASGGADVEPAIVERDCDEPGDMLDVDECGWTLRARAALNDEVCPTSKDRRPRVSVKQADRLVDRARRFVTNVGHTGSSVRLWIDPSSPDSKPRAEPAHGKDVRSRYRKFAEEICSRSVAADIGEGARASCHVDRVAHVDVDQATACVYSGALEEVPA
jgi:hypothetical protein